MAAKISNWLGTRFHLSGALSATAPLVSSTAVTREDPGAIETQQVAQPVEVMMSCIAEDKAPVVISSRGDTSSLVVN